VNIRDFATDKHKSTDDRPYGGGPGMVMKVEPIAAALQAVDAKAGRPGELVVLTAAQGSAFTQQVAVEWSKLNRLTILCGHYEGVDERVAEHLVDTQIRIGEYVLTGGEPAAAVISDAVVRLLPGVLGNEVSLADESHNHPGYFAAPQYTRPDIFCGWKVPEVLTNGNAAEIEKWRLEKAKNSGK
jgi:tRNA (guanine37-N1)-methyltransferase